ncbi:Vegetative incompatibility protein HET-E-1 [Ceratocystis platani]|uniref:Vegetative incompatibility protein HET-E-1 n=1 Tax=Ceratocystis fimbriata f. sp. platani TaxID=88771 RepID=A0A0F8CP11_CERFI|nr:Vegetative incompatibility protein HET-E-1 [Ceratocystis platani]
MSSLLKSLEARDRVFEKRRDTVARLIIPLMESFEAQCERDEDKETAQVVKRMILLRAEEAMDYVLTGREGGWQNRPAGEPAKKAHERQGKAVEKPPSAATKKAPSFADMVKRPATKPADTQDAARKTKSHEAASQGGEWQTVTHRKADANAPTGRYSQPAARQDNRVLDVQKTKSGFALLANKDGRSTLLEKSDKIKNYIGPGTEVVQAVSTDAYLIGPIERYLNGGGRAVEVSEEIIGECFAQATRVTPVYMTSKTRGNEKTFIVKIPAAGTKVPRQLRMGSRLIPTRLLAEKPRAIAQCSRCFGWHDAKKCSRAQLCKHCGSSEHESSRHPKCCGAEHECVSVCFICRGPHPADSKQCPLREKGHTPEERRTIRKAQQALTAEKKKACPKAGKSAQTQVVDLMECTETQAESSETEDQSEEEGDAPVASAGDKRKAAGKARSQATSPTISSSVAVQLEPEQAPSLLEAATPPPPPKPEPVALSILQEKIWENAYEGSRSKEPNLVEAFEKIVLSECHYKDEETRVKSTDRIEAKMTADLKVTSCQMRKVAEGGIERTKKQAALKQGVDDGLRAVQAVVGIMDRALRAAPEAAVIWATVCLGIEALKNPITEALENRQGIQYVLGRTEWYWNLTSLLLDENKGHTTTVVLRDTLEKNITKLFEKLLLYQIRSICLYHRSQAATFVRDMFLIDDWAGQLNDIKATENTVLHDMEQYNTQEIQTQIHRLNNTASDLQVSLGNIYAAIQSQAEQQEKRHHDDKDNECLRDLYTTDPRTDKKNIQDKKGGLLRDSYKWILEHNDFQKFKNEAGSRILWIKGDAGKGKTMLLCGIIDELELDPSTSPYYFFCQATGGNRLSSATSVLRGLIYHLAHCNPQLTKHVRKKYDSVGKKLFENESAWFEVRAIAAEMLKDPSLENAILVVDALDECTVDRKHLLDFITESSTTRWIVSSRNWPDIEESLNDAKQKVKIHLEINQDSVSAAVDSYIKFKVDQVAQKRKYDDETKTAVLDHLQSNARGTFLWVALTLEGHGSSVDSVAFSNDGQLLASGSFDKTVKIWDATSGSGDKTVKIWDATSGACVQTLEGHHRKVTSVVFSNDGQRLASGSGDKTVKIWDATSGVCVQTLEGHHREVTSVVFSNDGQRLASGSFDKTVKIWDATSGACVQTLEGHHRKVTSVVFSNDGQRLASGSGDKTVKIWDATSGVCVQTLEGHHREVTSVVFSNDGQRLASASWDKTVKIWDATSGVCVQTLEGHHRVVESVVFSNDGQRLASGSDDNTAKIWDATSGVCLQTLEGHGDYVTSAVFTNDEQRLASGSFDKTVKIWDATSGSEDNTIKIWDATSSACMQTLEGHHQEVRSVVFSNDRQRLASVSGDSAIKIWDVTSGACVQTLEGHEKYVTSVVFSNDAQRLASASRGGTVKIWDATSGACVQTLEGHGHIVTSVVFSNDGQRLASGSRDNTVKIWDATSGACVQTLEGHEKYVTSVVFSNDGQRLASGSRDNTVKIWDATSGACMQTLEGHEKLLRAMAAL